VAVLAALNIADELMRLQEHCRLLRGTVSETNTILYTRARSLRPAGFRARRGTSRRHPGFDIRCGWQSPRRVTCQPAPLTLASIQRPACEAGAAVNAG
jgi:hypothetical protein